MILTPGSGRVKRTRPRPDAGLSVTRDILATCDSTGFCDTSVLSATDFALYSPDVLFVIRSHGSEYGTAAWRVREMTAITRTFLTTALVISIAVGANHERMRAGKSAPAFTPNGPPRI